MAMLGEGETMKIWSCKIGEVDQSKLPSGADYPMRVAIAKVYREITGEDERFIFSGWGAVLTEPERAVVENRLPVHALTRCDRYKAALERIAKAIIRPLKTEGEVFLAIQEARVIISDALAADAEGVKQ